MRFVYHLLFIALIPLGSTAANKTNQKSGCFTWDPTPAVKEEIQQSLLETLDPKNKAILPGLPETDFPERRIFRMGQVESSALAFVAYRERKWDIIDGKERVGTEPPAFYQVFQYDMDTKNVFPLVPPMNDNQSSRMWKIETDSVKGCHPPNLKIRFKVCTECCDGRWYTVHLKYDPKSKAWSFSKISK
jgi:hypothetical protein